MISLKKYLEGRAPMESLPVVEKSCSNALPAVLAAYSSAMLAMSNCSLEACPSLGIEVQQRLGELSLRLSRDLGPDAVEEIDRSVQDLLRQWGENAARYYRGKAAEVKDVLLGIARTAEAISARDERCTSQLNLVTARLKQIATLDDVTEIRAAVEHGAAEFKSSIDRMAAEGKAAVDELRGEVKIFQARLEEAEELASRDALTGARNRTWVESAIKSRIAAGTEFCVAMIDIDGFKTVNDIHGHLAGDELLKEIATELRSACRSTDVVGRWGGDEFILLLDCGSSEGHARIDRLYRWVCTDYNLRGKDRKPVKLRVNVSMGLADYRKEESMKALIARADAAMYVRKADARAARSTGLQQVLPAGAEKIPAVP